MKTKLVLSLVLLVVSLSVLTFTVKSQPAAVKSATDSIQLRLASVKVENVQHRRNPGQRWNTTQKFDLSNEEDLAAYFKSRGVPRRNLSKTQ